MHDAALVRGGQPARDLNRVVDRLERREPFRLLEADAERVAFEQLHDRVDDAGIVPDVVQRQNVGMVERGDRLRFALEARQPVLHLFRVRGKHLDGHFAAQPGISRPVDLAHAPAADWTQDFVRPQPRADAYRIVMTHPRSASWLRSARCARRSRSFTAFCVI